MLKQSLSLKMLQKLSPQQIQLMKLLQVPTNLLDDRIKEEVENNPALEEDNEDSLPKDTEEVLYMRDAEKNNETTTETDSPTVDQDTTSNAEEAEADVVEDTFEDLNMSEYLGDESESNDFDYSENTNQEERKHQPAAIKLTFHDLLEEQLNTADFNELQMLIGLQIIGSIDDDGYLRRPIDAIIDDILFAHNVECELEEVMEVLYEIQSFDPAGIACRDLKECLELQIERLPHHLEGLKIARIILEEHFEQFTKKHFEKIQKQLEINDEKLKQAIELLLALNPKPGNAAVIGAVKENYIIPDFYVIENDFGHIEVGLNARNAPDLRISNTYKDMLKSYEKASRKDPKQKEAVQFIKQKIDSAKWFIDAIKQRQRTLLITMQTIFDKQSAFFKSGSEKSLKPMILKDIAEITGLDISTISRVASSKYVQTEFGIFSLKYFFSEGLNTDTGEEVSTREVKKILTEIILGEKKGKPMSDQKLTKLLQEQGYNIARRTVAKYREQLDLPVARLRKEL